MWQFADPGTGDDDGKAKRDPEPRNFWIAAAELAKPGL
jgi:hypothetical protein